MTVELVQLFDRLAALPRTGWLLRGVAEPESIAEHSFGVCVVASLIVDDLRESGVTVDGERVLRMALVHDLAEVFTGDIPMPAKSDALRHALAETEERTLAQHLNSAQLALWREAEAAESLEARVVKAADKLQMIIKALTYEQEGRGRLAEFFEGKNRKTMDLAVVERMLADVDRLPRSSMKDDVERIHGHRAAMAILEKRPEDVIRVGCTREHLAAVEHALGKRETHVGVLRDHEIEKLATTKQHEGICLEAKARAWLSPPELVDLLTTRKGVAVALDRVRNSYNIGAILRSAAFFGVDAVILGAPAPHPGLDPNAIRVAEGGAEHVALARTTDLADSVGRLRRRGVTILGTDGHADADASKYDFPRPCVVVLGNEREGLGARVRAQCDALVAIRGTGAVESLNVGVAAGVLIARLMIGSR